MIRRFREGRLGNYCRTVLFVVLYLEMHVRLVAVAVCFMAEVRAEFDRSSLQPRCAIDEEFGIVARVFLFELREKQLRRHRRSGRIEPKVEKYVGFGLDCGQEPVLFAIDLTTGSSSAIFAGFRSFRGSRSDFRTHLCTVDRHRSMLNFSRISVLESDRRRRRSSTPSSIIGFGGNTRSTNADSMAVLPPSRRTISTINI